MKHKKITKWLAASLAAAMLVQTAVPQYAGRCGRRRSAGDGCSAASGRNGGYPGGI